MASPSYLNHGDTSRGKDLFPNSHQKFARDRMGMVSAKRQLSSVAWLRGSRCEPNDDRVGGDYSIQSHHRSN
jgi:hypothetical protein